MRSKRTVLRPDSAWIEHYVCSRPREVWDHPVHHTFRLEPWKMTERRVALGLTKTKLAKMIGRDTSTVTNYERGTRLPAGSAEVKLIEILGEEIVVGEATRD